MLVASAFQVEVLLSLKSEDSQPERLLVLITGAEFLFFFVVVNKAHSSWKSVCAVSLIKRPWTWDGDANAPC